MEVPLSQTIRILLVDDHRIFRESLRLRLAQEEGFEVVGEAGNADEAVRLLGTVHPDLLLLDLGLPDGDGLALARRVLGQEPAPRILILSGYSDPEVLEQALQAGVTGYVLKAGTSEELIKAIRTVAAGRMYLCSDLSPMMLARFKRLLDRDHRPEQPVLSAREAEVLRLFAEGRNTKEIALQLGLSSKTIETHRLRIMEKLDVHSIAELTKYAIRKGLTSL